MMASTQQISSAVQHAATARKESSKVSLEGPQRDNELRSTYI